MIAAHRFITSQPGNLPGNTRRDRGGRGSTLIEVVLVLVILVLAVWLALDVAAQVQQRRRRDRFVADLREFSAALQNPPEAAPVPLSTGSALPPVVEELRKKPSWTKGSPFGGSYVWLAPETPRPPPPAAVADKVAVASPVRKEPVARNRGAITVTAFLPDAPLTLTRADLLAIDAQLDDGNLATGRFRTGFNGWPVYSLNSDK